MNGARDFGSLALHPAIKTVLDAMPPLTPDVYRSLPPLEAVRRLRAQVPPPLPADPDLMIEDLCLAVPQNVRVRVYRSRGGPLPIVVNFHGGGWATGSIEMDEVRCREIAKGAECLVASVEYRLAPEHKFPAALNDAYGVVAWMAEHGGRVGGDPSRLAVMGSSSGGNLAAAVALAARDRGQWRLAAQWLAYPVCDIRQNAESYRLFADGPLLTADLMSWFWQQYVDPADRSNPYASPLLALDVGGLPPTLIITAAFDPLRDEAEAYASRLRGAGVEVRCTRYEGMIHGFLSIAPFLEPSQAAVAEGVQMLRRIFL